MWWRKDLVGLWQFVVTAVLESTQGLVVARKQNYNDTFGIDRLCSWRLTHRKENHRTICLHGLRQEGNGALREHRSGF